jgi:hypothetical protein
MSCRLAHQRKLHPLPAYCLQVLLHPMPRSARWNQQLSPYLLQVNDQLLLQPSSVLLSVVRALHVLRGVLQEVGGSRAQHSIAQRIARAWFAVLHV